MTLPNSPHANSSRCVQCAQELSSDGQSYCSDACRLAARNERNRQRGKLIAEISLAVVSIALSVINGFVATFPTSISLWVFTGVAALVAMDLEYKRRTGHLFPRSQRKLFAIGALMLVVLVASVAFDVTRPAPSSCTPESAAGSGVLTDPRTNITWQKVYYCPTPGNTYVYQNPGFGTIVGTMNAEQRIWVICWKRTTSSGIWYYTQGDGWRTKRDLHAWGFIPQQSLNVSAHPDPAIPGCAGGAPESWGSGSR